MKEKDFTLDDLIWDDFNLPLEEEIDPADYLTLEEIKAELATRVGELNKLGYSISIDQIVRYDIRDNKETTAGVQPVSEHKYLFVISKHAARKKNKQYFDMIFYHELCHILQIKYLFNGEFIYYHGTKLLPDPDKKEYVYSVLKVDGGHTPLWQMFVNKLNRVLKIAPPISKIPTDDDLSNIFSEGFYGVSILDEDFEFEGFYDYFPEVMKD
jgi:hypothetical protein